MFKGKFLKFKENLSDKESGNNKKTIENLVVFVIVLIITVVAINYVWNGNKNSKYRNGNDINSKSKVLASDENSTENKDNLESNLENILAKIKGVGKVNVLVTYSKSSEVVPMYSEDSSQKTTEETDKQRWKKNCNRE